MPVTTAQLAAMLKQPERPEPEIPGFLAGPLARHDIDRCECHEGDGPCTAALWDEGAIGTDEARERLGA